MANIDYTVGGVATAIPAEGLNLFVRKQAVVDFLSTATNGVNRSSADVLRLIDVAVGELVLLVSAEVLTAEGGTFTFDIGDGDDVDCYFDGVDGNAAAGTVYSSNQTYVA